MALRLIEVFHQSGKADAIDKVLEEHPALHSWHDHLPGGETVSRILARSEDAEGILHDLQACCQQGTDLRAVIIPVEAAIPRPGEPEAEPEREEERRRSRRISVEELYQKVSEVSSLTTRHLVMSAVACVVAAIGLLRNDVAVVIGSMMIAPLLGPNTGLVLATTLADGPLARKALRAILAGGALVLGVSVAIGLLVPLGGITPELAARSEVRHSLILLALATGVAGAYSVTTGVSEALVGVMVSVALLPPLVASGIFLGAGSLVRGADAFLLFLINIAGINLSGTMTFVAQGIRPQDWWEARRAARVVRLGVLLWVLLLLVFAGLIVLEQKIQ